MHKSFIYDIYDKDYTESMKEFFAPYTTLTVYFSVEWQRLPAEPEAGFPLPRYEPHRVRLNRIDMIYDDGKVREFLPSMEVDGQVNEDIEEILLNDIPESVLNKASDDFYADNEGPDRHEDF